MRILEIITVPFFAPRGTSFSSLERTRAFSELGHRVDVLTYGIGEDVSLPGMRVYRVPSLGVRSIRMGPSLPKLAFDVMLAARTVRQLLLGGRYDLVHVHEESAYWVAWLGWLHRGPVLYDMHSSLVEQLENFGTGGSSWARKLLQGIFRRLEARALRRAAAVIVICPDLLERVRRVAPGAKVELIENLPVGWELPEPRDTEVEELRRSLGVGGSRVLLYTGTFGGNQGLELLLDALALVLETRPDTKLVLVGGTGADLARIRARVEGAGLGGQVVLRDARPYAEMPAYMAAADVLVSPRTRGTNTPLKIYSYLASGRPIVATRLHTHTQVLSDATACLADAEPRSLAGGLLRVLDDPAYATQIGKAGAEVAEEKYGIERYMREVRTVLSGLEGSRGDAR